MKPTAISALTLLLAAPAGAQLGFHFVRKDYPTGLDPAALAVGDVDGSGAPDLVIASKGDDQVAVRLNNGDGTFGPPLAFATIGRPNGVALGHLDGDGDLDLVVLSDGKNRLEAYLGGGDGSFAKSGEVSLVGDLAHVALIDLDGDGVSEAVVSDQATDLLVIGSGFAGGTFSTLTSVPVLGPPRNVVAGDLDGDGALDLLVGADSISLFDGTVLLGDGALGFTQLSFPSATGGAPIWMAAGDVDEDGKLDAVVVEDDLGDPSAAFFPGQGDGTFGAGFWFTIAPPFEDRSTLADFNGDGHLDLVTSTSTGGFSPTHGIRGFVGDGTGSLVTVTEALSQGSISALVVADLDLDGLDDVVTASATTNQLRIHFGTLDTVSAFPSKLNPFVGGTQSLGLALGPAHAGELYLVLGTLSGTAPGFDFGGQHVPLNFDVYTQLSISSPGAVVLGSLGFLDAAGQAQASFVLPPGPSSLAWLHLHHAFLVFDFPGSGALGWVSEALPLNFY